MLLVWHTIATVFVLRICNGLISNVCNFNSMCTCTLDEHSYPAKTIHSVSCFSVPFYKFPTLPEGSISHLEVVGTKISILEYESLAGCQVQALILSNNRIQQISDRSFSSLSKSITSLDLSYNKLDSIPFACLKDVRNLQWINFHGNEISSLTGTWSHMKNTISTLFLGENDLTVIPNDTSKNLQGLRHFKTLIWLNLDGNRIYDIQRDSLPSSSKTVSLSHNLLTDFPVDVVTSSPYLQWFYLRGNHITLIPQYTFFHMFYLEKLDLAENYISTLPAFLFNHSLNIRDINLAFNDFTELRENCFSGLNTGRIILSYNSLEKMAYDSFNGIFNTLEYLDVDHNNLRDVPEELNRLTSLKYLYLSWNFLKSISPSAFDSFCHNLKALSLSGNFLTEIPYIVLQNCTKISYFNIAFNEISNIEREHFQNWGSNIKNLVLVNNKITHLQDNIFSELEELKELSLSFNPIRQIETDAFLHLNRLESLEISFAFDRTHLDHAIFEPLKDLKWLSLDNNNIETISPFRLPELKYLNLESNKIHFISPALFKFSTKLQDVRFSNNELSLIKTGTFSFLNSLETILLSNNKIKHIEKYGFSDLPSLSSLVLSHNELKTISPDAFSNLPNINKIDLYNNFLTKVSFTFFTNISNSLQLNLSRNQISSCTSDQRILNIHVLDLRYNNFAKVPPCIENTAALKKLSLDYNIINDLEDNIFMHLTSLESLGLQQNNIKSIGKKSFLGLQSLQFLDLSKNLINQLHVGQFTNISKLRVLNLSGNHLSYLPREVFKSAHIEMLDLSENSFSVVPSTSLSDIGISLRYFLMAGNNIEHIDITTFPDIPLLQQLDLRNNKLTILPDNVFTSLGFLHSLDLGFNPLRSNFKELFHYAQTLRFLNLAYVGISSTPYFPLPNLLSLNLSYNNIQAINKFSFQELSKLKVLDLSRNSLTQIPSHLWTFLPNLKSLYLSHNPIKEILTDSFLGLQSLQELNIQYLDFLTKFESEALVQLKIISKLSMQTWPKIDNFSKKLCYLFSHIDQLRILKIRFLENDLTDQLLCVTNRKIRYLEITGKNLKTITKDAFARFTKNPELIIKIHGTKIEELPSDLFSNMFKIGHLTLILTDNYLTHLHPEIFYGNSSRWKNVGTTIVSGGLFISNNPFRCDCHLSWLSHWLKRWTRETLHSHNSPVESAIKMNEIIKEATCIDYRSNVKIPIVDLHHEDMSCHASALSNGTYSNNASVIFIVLLLFIKCFR